MNETVQTGCAPLGTFYVNTRNGSGCYELDIAVPPGVRGIQPSLSLYYTSSEGRFSPLIGSGWELDGLPFITAKGTNQYEQDGKKITVETEKLGLYFSYDLEGNKSTYAADKAGCPCLVLQKIEDPFGNVMVVNRDDQGRPLTINYGSKTLQNRSLHFSYGKSHGRLETIRTEAGGQEVLQYRLRYAEGTLASIQLEALGAKASKRNPVYFFYEPVNGKAGALAAITETSSLQFKLSYSKNKGVLARYDVVTGRPFGKKSIYQYQVQGGKLSLDAAGLPYLNELIVWNISEKIGTCWSYDSCGKEARLLRSETRFSMIQEQAGGDIDAAFEPITKPEAAFLKISEILYSYEKQKSGEFLVASETVTEFVEQDKSLPPAVKKFAYDDDGSLVRTTTAKTTNIRSYIKGPGPGNSRYLHRCALYDASEGKKAMRPSLLKDDLFDHSFDASNGRHVSIQHQTRIHAEIYSRPEISELSPMGLPARVSNAAGAVIQKTYDENGFVTTEVFSSAEDNQTICQEMVRDPAFGTLTYARSTEGAVRTVDLNGFGETVSVSAFDPSNPDSWQDEKNVIPVQMIETYFDKDFQAFVIVQRQCGNKGDQPIETRTVLDTLWRPVIYMQEASGNKWQVKLIRYSSERRIGAESLPFEILAKRKNVAGVLKSVKKGKIRWSGQYYDLFDRLCLETYPDGSKQHTGYYLTAEKAVEISRVCIAPNGERGKIRVETAALDGTISVLQPGDTAPTTYLHDVEGQVVQKTDPMGQITQFSWNALGRCIFEKNPVTGTRTATYGASFELEEETQNDIRFSYRYDWRGRPVEKRIRAGENPEEKYYLSYETDPENKSFSVLASHPEGWFAKIRTAPSGEEIERTVTLGPVYSQTIKTDLHPNGNIRVRHYPDGRSMEYEFSKTGWISKIREGEAGLPLVQLDRHDFLGRPEKVRFSNGVTERRSFSGYGNLASLQIDHEKDPNRAPLFAQKYTYTSGYLGLVASISEENGDGTRRSIDYCYDDNGRYRAGYKADEKSPVKRIGEYYQYGDSGSVERFERSGNVFAKEAGLSNYQCAGLSQNNKPYLDFRYDSHGQITAVSGQENAWDLVFGAAGDLEKVSATRDGDTVTTDCVTDATGQRLIRADSTGHITFFIDKDYQILWTPDGKALSTIKIMSENGCLGELTEPVAADQPRPVLFREFEASHPPKKTVSNNDRVSGIRQQGAVFLHLNSLGTILLATDHKGREVARLSFDSYGNMQDESSGRCHFDVVFAGMMLDPSSGLYYAGQRYFSPEFLCFLTPDPARSSTDPYAYPSDPINYFDYDGACGANGFCRGFLSNYGRSTNAFGSTLAMFVTSLPVFFFWDRAVFDAPYDKAFRWALVIAFWFSLVGILNGVFAHYNTQRRIRCGRARRRPAGDSELGTCGTTAVPIFIGTLVGVSILGPIGSFIGTENCAPWHMFNCSFSFYRKGFIRGLTCAVSPGVAGLVRKLFKCCPRTSDSLFGRYVTSVASQAAGSLAWQAMDLAVVSAFPANASTPAEGSQISDLEAKMPFVLGMVTLFVITAKPSFFWSLLPAVFHHRSMDSFWNVLFDERAVFAPDHQRPGEFVPLFSGVSGVSIEEIDIEFSGDISAEDGPDEELTENVRISITMPDDQSEGSRAEIELERLSEDEDGGAEQGSSGIERRATDPERKD